MAVFINQTPRKVQFVGYRADGLKFDQHDPSIYPGYARYINRDHYGDYPIYIVVAYMSGANVPDRLNIKQSNNNRAGAGLEYKNIFIDNLGLKLDVGMNSTTYYSTGLAVTKTRFDSVWTLSEKRNKWCFKPGGKFTNKMLCGW
ncbi:MAG: hypothetical protein AAFW70_26990 [Cyanobacteria bacterium J06635_10]